MAPRLTVKIAITFLVLVLYTSTLPTTALAASPNDELPIKEHQVKFYLDPTLVPDMEYAKTVLSDYVSDMNAILAKNTNRRLTFDPQTNIILTTVKPHTDSARPPMPTDGFEIWVYAILSDRQSSYGGYAGLDISGAGVLAGLKWMRLYDPTNLDASQVFDYSVQLNNMLHELAHVFGAGIGEYYNLASITDTTNTEPLLNIRLSDPQDAYWSAKPDFMTDPLLRITRAASRTDYLNAVQFSSLTAAVINGDYRNGVPSFDHFTVQVLDENDQPIPNANVKVWNVYSTSQLLFDGTTDGNGQVNLAWGGSGNSHNSNNFLRLIKVYKDNKPLMQPGYLSIFDADIAQLVTKADSFTVTFKALPPQPQTAIFNSLANQDGWLIKTANTAKNQNSAATTLNLGDDAANKQYRSILSFDTSSLPDNAIITSVTLKFKYAGVTGTLPFGTHGNLLVDVRSGSFSDDPALQLGDFGAASGRNKVLIFGSNKADNWFSRSFNPADLQYINLTDLTQFRLRFAKENNNDRSADFLKIYSGNAGAANRPQLIVEYIVP